MLLPELVLQDLVRKLLLITTADWNDPTVKPSRKLLTQLFATDDNDNPLRVDNFNYLDGAKAILLLAAENSRKLEVNFGYNSNRAGLPTIHILLPSETSANNSLGLGDDLEFDDDDDPLDSHAISQGYEVKAYGYQTTYNFMLSSDNTNEVLIMYYWLRNMLVASSDHLELMGLQNIRFSGQDLSLSNELVSPNVFHRNLQLSFIYENKIVSNVTQRVRRKLTAFKP